MIEKNDRIECEITALALGGRGVARVDGLVVFVERSLPGQRVLAQVDRVKKRFAEARAVEVLRQSEHWRAPFCPHFGTCGGCLMQDLDYAEQLRWKNQHVADALARIGGVWSVDQRPILGSPEVVHYRNKMEYAFEGDGAGLRLGLKERGGSRVVNLTDCRLQSPESASLLNAAREFCRASGVAAWNGRHRGFWRHLVIRQSTVTGQILAHCITSPDSRHYKTAAALGQALKEAVPALTGFAHSTSSNRASLAVGEEGILALGADHIEEELGGLRFRVSANAFFQTNTAAAGLLYAEILDMAGLTGAEVVYDLYCGVGGISLTLARHAARVYGFEISEEAVADARENAAANGLDNCLFTAGRVDADLFRDLPHPEVLVCDPPRAGLDDAAREAILELAPRRLLAVSCDPATLARDVALLAPNYSLAAARPVDLFPHTAHVETVALLTRLA